MNSRVGRSRWHPILTECGMERNQQLAVGMGRAKRALSGSRPGECADHCKILELPEMPGRSHDENVTIFILQNILINAYEWNMDLIDIYECFCDRTRLRILNLLIQGPLCVCHFQDILGEPQVKVSKHLGYLKARGLVDVRREGYWRIYSLVAKPSRMLKTNLACLQDCATGDKIFQRDTEKLTKLRDNLEADSPVCCARPQTSKLKS